MKKGAGDSKSDAPPEPSSFIANRSSLGKRCDGDNLFYHSSAERALTKGMGASFNRATQSTPARVSIASWGTKANPLLASDVHLFFPHPHARPTDVILRNELAASILKSGFDGPDRSQPSRVAALKSRDRIRRNPGSAS
jgi:hypothetical protein